MKLTPANFKLKWNDRFANNDDFLITEADLREFAQDVADSAGGSVTAEQLEAVATTLPATTTRTGAYTLQLADAGCQVPVSVATGVNFTIPADDAVNFPTGTILEISQEDAGAITVVGGAVAAGGTVLVQGPGGAVKTGGPFAVVGLRKHGPNLWRVRGGVA